MQCNSNSAIHWHRVQERRARVEGKEDLVLNKMRLRYPSLPKRWCPWAAYTVESGILDGGQAADTNLESYSCMQPLFWRIILYLLLHRIFISQPRPIRLYIILLSLKLYSKSINNTYSESKNRSMWNEKQRRSMKQLWNHNYSMFC